MGQYYNIIQQYLPSTLWKEASRYKIPMNFIQEEKELVILVLESKSLEDFNEKQNWFDLMGMMNKTQVEKLRDILIKEKQRIQEIEEKYGEKKKEIKRRYENKFNVYSYNSRMKKMKENEIEQRRMEMEDADSLLDNI